jgi:predicted house-cleaning noncanonical NTP pyrophosphatase (MazG superfamily)
MEAQGVSYEEVERIRLDKKEQRGGFSEGLILREVQS